MLIINKYKTDAIRLYLINSFAVYVEQKRLDKDGIRIVVKDVMYPWRISLLFFIQLIYIEVTLNSSCFRDSNSIKIK
jgi:isoleucyl-tRNA synthetase